ncbi:hypothetical protein KSS87_017572, partial [Heliosperma pusillum]
NQFFISVIYLTHSSPSNQLFPSLTHSSPSQKIVTDSPYSPSPDCQTMSFAFYCCGTNQSMPPPRSPKRSSSAKEVTN